MFKRLVLCLTLVVALVLGPIGGGALAIQEGQVCTMIEGSKVIQMMPNASMKGVIVPEDISITLGPELTQTMVENLSSQSGMDWNEGHMGMIEIDFGRGPEPLMMVVKTTDVKDCK